MVVEFQEGAKAADSTTKVELVQSIMPKGAEGTSTVAKDAADGAATAAKDSHHLNNSMMAGEKAAGRAVGQSLEFTPLDGYDGKLGPAAAVSEVLRKAGMPLNNAQMRDTEGLAKSLERNGFTKIDAVDGADQIADNADRLSPSQEAILDAAKANVGNEDIWNFGPNAKYTNDGKLGAATAVANILDKAGYQGIETASIVQLAKELAGERDKNGDLVTDDKGNIVDAGRGFDVKPADQGKPGDIWMEFGNPNRIAIYGEGGKMYTVDRNGKWIERNGGPRPSANARAYSPPATCDE